MMLKIWKSLGRAIGTIPAEIKKEAGTRGLVAMWAGITGGVVIVSWIVWSMYASKGCSVELPFWEAVGKGLGALFMGVIAAALGGFGIGFILHIPDGIGAAAGQVRDWRDHRRWRRSQGLPPSASPPGAVRNWILFFGTLAAVVIAMGFAIGYIAWMIIC